MARDDLFHLIVEGGNLFSRPLHLHHRVVERLNGFSNALQVAVHQRIEMLSFGQDRAVSVNDCGARPLRIFGRGKLLFHPLGRGFDFVFRHHRLLSGFEPRCTQIDDDLAHPRGKFVISARQFAELILRELRQVDREVPHPPIVTQRRENLGHRSEGTYDQIAEVEDQRNRIDQKCRPQAPKPHPLFRDKLRDRLRIPCRSGQ